MNEWLEELVPPIRGDGDWDDVLRRARLPARRRLVFAVALCVAALAVAPALGVLLTRDGGPRLPREADRSNVVVIVQPATGRVVVQAARWKGHDGICYLVLLTRAGCAPRSARKTVVLTPPLAGYTFDRRVVSGAAVSLAGKHVPLVVRRFEKLDVTFFLTRGRMPRFLREATLFDANGKVVAHFTFKH